MARKKKLSPSAEMLKSTPLVQLSAVNCRQLCYLGLQNKVVVSLHSFPCILISRSLPNLNEMYMTAFRHKLIHNFTTQSKTSKMAANGGNVPHQRATITSHTVSVCTFKMIYCTMHAAALQQLWIYDSFDGCWLPSTALFQYLKCQDQRISKNCRSTFIFCSSWNLWVGPIFHI